MLHSPDEVRRFKRPIVDWEWPTEPYRGLNYFTHSDAPLFGQRDTDIENCSTIVGAAGNKVLLLHGRSGTGKSSFLRAGLLPRLEESNFGCLATASAALEPLLVRCTADPIARLRREIVERLVRQDTFEYIDGIGHREALSRLSDVPTDASSLDIADVLLSGFGILSKHLSRSLLLTIDQGEEIFTSESTAEARNAFFRFIEELCIEPFDIKLIISIRTEYYGQFCDQLRIDPNIKVSTSRTSLNQYMLHGLRDSLQIEAAILRPTLKETLEPYGVPHSHYRFEFDSEVPKQIASDLLRHSGESSTLPIMQIVCRDLYRAARSGVKTTKDVRISMEDYNRLGRVDGRVNAFIENSLLDALRNVRRPAMGKGFVGKVRAALIWLIGRKEESSEVAKWQEVLAGLVARQEGGVLATLLVDEASIVKDAIERGIPEPVSACLDEMSKEKYALLRVSSAEDRSGQSTRQFSLGHDALAPSLFQWKEARVEILRERQAATRFRLAFAVALAALAGVTYVYLMQRYSLRLQTSRISRAVADTDLTPFFRKKILFSLAAAKESGPPFAEQLSHKDHVAKLRRELGRSPLILSPPAAALGISSSGFEIVRLDPFGKVFIDSIKPGQRRERLLGSIAMRALNGQVAISQSAIGYLAGLTYPVVYQGGYISWWPNDEDPTNTRPNEVDLNSLLPPDFLGGGFPWLDIAGGRLRLTALATVPRIAKLLEIAFTTSGGFRVSNVTSAAWPGVFPPTFSPYTNKYAFLLEGHLKRGDRGGGDPIDLGLTQEPKGPQTGEEPKQPDLYVESLGFAHLGESIVVRNSRRQMSIFTEPQSPPVRFELNGILQKDPIRPRFGRPVIGAIAMGKSWRVAWVGEDGIVVVDSRDDGYATLVRYPPLLPASSLNGISRLEFSDDGNLLSAISQPGFQEPMSYRVWDLSSERQRLIDSLDDNELVSEGCSVAKLETGSNQFSKQEAELLFRERFYQPCKE